MRAGGVNLLAVLAAAVAIYAIGFVIYGLIIPQETYTATMSAEQVTAAEARMPLGVVMPLAMAVFLALLFKWGGVNSASQGAQWAAVVALASAVPTVWYGWVYGDLSEGMALVDSVHLLLAHIGAGAILGAWR